jgi:hypothetical protein
MTARPLTLKQANEFITRFHRHHKPVQGHRFSIAAVSPTGDLLGVCVVGRPVARAVNPDEVAEVTRLATNGEKNVCSFLYASAARAATAMGFKKIQTYILEDEPGTSLRAAGWQREATTAGGQWTHTDGKPRRTDQPTCPKHRYARILCAQP